MPWEKAPCHNSHETIAAARQIPLFKTICNCNARIADLARHSWTALLGNYYIVFMAIQFIFDDKKGEVSNTPF